MDEKFIAEVPVEELDGQQPEMALHLDKEDLTSVYKILRMSSTQDATMSLSTQWMASAGYEMRAGRKRALK
jgi:hypothetical protein